MDTRKAASKYRMSHWAQVMRERGESGLSIKAYCEKAGFHENSYYYWQRKLREAASEQAIKKQNEVGEAASNMPQRFIEVKLPEQNTQLSYIEASHAIRIETADMRITASSTYPVDKLAALLRELVRPC